MKTIPATDITTYVGAGGDLSFGGDTFGADKTIGSNDTYALSFETDGNEAMKIDTAGIITKPLQPAFILKKDTVQTDVGTSEFDISWETEIADRNGDFSTPSFTAPVTGIYQMDVQVEGVQLDSAGQYTQLRLLASNRSFYTVFRNPTQLSADSSVDLKLSVMVDMDANDTAKVTMHFANGHLTSDIGISYSSWSGYLVA